MSLQAWQRSPTKKALDIVRTIIKGHSTPLTTHQLYNLAVQHETGRPVTYEREHNHASNQPPHPENAIRSMAYLKRVVLPNLVVRNEVQKIHTTRTLSEEEVQQRLQTMTKAARKTAHLPTTVDEWRWQLKTPPAVKVTPPPEPVFGTEVGVGEDWTHLNRRRRRAREEKISRNVAWMNELKKARDNASEQSQAA
ncbi:hypothetical protein ABKN59_003751 [Abortiporus biennis]